MELFGFFRKEFPWGQVSDGWGGRGVSCCSLRVTKMGQGSLVDSTVQLYLPFLKATLIKSQISLKFQGWTDNHFLKSHIHEYVLSDSLCLSWKTDQHLRSVEYLFIFVTGPHYVSLASLQFILETGLSSVQRVTCLCLSRVLGSKACTSPTTF